MSSTSRSASDRPNWSLFSNHGLVLTTLARRPDLRLRHVAEVVGITERSTQAIVNDLVAVGYLERIKEGRRNRYVVRGDQPLEYPGSQGHELADVMTALVSSPLARPSSSPCQALVLACCDHRYQEPLRQLIAEEGLLGRSEIIMVPGGATSLAGRDKSSVLAAMELAASSRNPQRLLLVAHQGCSVPGVSIKSGSDLFDMPRKVAARRRRVVELVRKRLGREPELWFLDQRGTRHVRGRTKKRDRNAGSDLRKLAS